MNQEQNQQVETYYPTYKEIQKATEYFHVKAGESKPLTLEKKAVWHWILHRYLFFKSQGKGFFDNQEDIALNSGVSLSTVRRFLKELEEMGYIKITMTQKYGGHKSNSYEILYNLILSKDARPKGLPKRKEKVVDKPSQTYQDYLNDESDLPF